MAYEIETRTLERRDTAMVRFRSAPQELPAHMGPALAETSAYLGELGMDSESNRVFARYLEMGADFDMEAGIIVAAPVQPKGRVQPGALPACEAATTLHVGPYQELGAAYGALQAWMSANGRMPGGHEDGDHVMTTFEKAMLTANFFFADQKAMLAMEIARTSFRDSPEKFDLTPMETSRFPADWKNKGEIDVVVCNKLEGAYGMAKLPWWGKTMIVALADEDGERRPFSLVARTLAHELGHFLGLGHGSGDGQAANIMTPSDLGLPIDESVLWPEQIEEMQTKLARNLARQGNRVE